MQRESLHELIHVTESGLSHDCVITSLELLAPDWSTSPVDWGRGCLIIIIPNLFHHWLTCTLVQLISMLVSLKFSFVWCNENIFVFIMMTKLTRERERVGSFITFFLTQEVKVYAEVVLFSFFLPRQNILHW